MKTLLNRNEMKAVVERLEKRGMISRSRPLSHAEVERITNDKRNTILRKKVAA